MQPIRIYRHWNKRAIAIYAGLWCLLLILLSAAYQSANPCISEPDSSPYCQMTQPQVLHGYRHPVNTIAFSPDSKMLVSSGFYGEDTVYVWNLETKSVQQSLGNTPIELSRLAFTPNQHQIIGTDGNRGTVEIWNMEDGELLHSLNVPSSTGRGSIVFAVSPDGKYLAVSNTRELEDIQIWNIDTAEISQVISTDSAGFSNLVFSHDGKTLISTGTYDSNGYPDHRIQFWDMDTGERQKTLVVPLAGTDYVWKVDVDPHQHRLAVLAPSQVMVWNTETGQIIQTVDVPTSHYGPAPALSAEHQIAAAFKRGEWLRLWDLATGQPIRYLPQPDDNDWATVAISPDGRTIAAGTYDNTIALWQMP